MGRRPLAEFTAEWWERYAGQNLERSTLRTYAVVWNRHLLPRVGHLELGQHAAAFGEAQVGEEVGGVLLVVELLG